MSTNVSANVTIILQGLAKFSFTCSPSGTWTSTIVLVYGMERKRWGDFLGFLSRKKKHIDPWSSLCEKPGQSMQKCKKGEKAKATGENGSSCTFFGLEKNWNYSREKEKRQWKNHLISRARGLKEQMEKEIKKWESVRVRIAAIGLLAWEHTRSGGAQSERAICENPICRVTPWAEQWASSPKYSSCIRVRRVNRDAAI